MKTINKLFFIVGIIALFSCDDILEKDITDELVQVIYPINSQEITSNVVNFQWNPVKGANDYRVQVFASNSSIVLDSLVPAKNFTYPLSPGDYQWRVRAENYAYTSAYSLNNTFKVIQSNDLSTQQVILSFPSDNFYSKDANIILSWETISVAEKYSYDIVNNITNEVKGQNADMTTTSITLNNTILNQDGEYKWRVKAKNTTSETPYSSRILYLDTVLPNQPTNQLPANNSIQIVNQQLNFSWSIPSDSGTVQSPITYTIEFSNTVSFSSILESSNVTSNTYQQSFSSVGDYYWRVKAKDKAGNIGISSSPFKFTIN
jgi:hypothetical protein